MDGTTPDLRGEGEAPLSFVELNRRLSAIPDHDATAPKSSGKAKLGSAVALLAFALSFPVQHLPIPSASLLALLGGLLAIEIIGLVMSVWYSRGELANTIRPLADYAEMLDHDYSYHFEIHDWLVRQPPDLLKRHAAMAKFRRERFAQRLPLLAGAIPTLGVIPVLTAVYLQAREYAAGRTLTWIDGIFGFLLLTTYILTWTSSLTKSRMEAMDMYLQDALSEATEAGAPGSV
jgi:hypothetical protein